MLTRRAIVARQRIDLQRFFFIWHGLLFVVIPVFIMEHDSCGIWKEEGLSWNRTLQGVLKFNKVNRAFGTVWPPGPDKSSLVSRSLTITG